MKDSRIKKTKVEKDSATMYREFTVFKDGFNLNLKRCVYFAITQFKLTNVISFRSSNLIPTHSHGKDQYQVRLKSDGYQGSGLFQNPFYCLMGKFLCLMD